MLGLRKVSESDILKRIDEMEEELEARMDKIENNFLTFKEVVLKLQDENIALKEERKTLLSKYKEMLSQLEIPQTQLAKDIHEKYVKPVHQKIKEEVKEDVDLLQKLIQPGGEEAYVKEQIEKAMKEKKQKHKEEAKKAIKLLEEEQEKKEKTKQKKDETKTKKGEIENKEKKPVKDEEEPALDLSEIVYGETKSKNEKERKREKKEKEKNKAIETPIDELFELISEKGEIKVSDAALQFGVKETQIESWAEVLEDHRLIDIKYPAFGRPILIKKTKQ